MKITRGFSRKTNLGNYESFDTWATYEEEILTEENMKNMGNISEDLYKLAKFDVLKAIEDYKLELKVKEDEQKEKDNPLRASKPF